MLPQNYPTLTNLKKCCALKFYRLTPVEKEFYSKRISQLGELRKEQLYLYEKFVDGGVLGKIDDLAIKAAEFYTMTDEVTRYSTYRYALAMLDDSISQYKSGTISLDRFLRDTGMNTFRKLEIKHILSLPIPEARLEIAKCMTDKTQFVYKAVERGLMTLSETGEIASSLTAYPKSIITRYLDGVDMVLHGYTSSQKWGGVQQLFGLVILGMLAQQILQKVAGESSYYDPDLKREVTNDPYGFMSTIGGFTFGGAQIGQLQQVSKFTKILADLITQEISGKLNNKQRMATIRQLLQISDSLGEAYIPFLRKSMDLVETFSGTRSCKILTTFFDNITNRQTALRRNKIERDWVETVQHTLFGTNKMRSKANIKYVY
jgi:hypothetical protein